MKAGIKQRSLKYEKKLSSIYKIKNGHFAWCADDFPKLLSYTYKGG